MWPSSIYEGHDRLDYFYLHTKLTNRLDDIREVNEYIEITLLQSTFSLQNNHELLSHKAHILHNFILFIFQVRNNILKYLKLYYSYFFVFFSVSALTTQKYCKIEISDKRGEKYYDVCRHYFCKYFIYSS